MNRKKNKNKFNIPDRSLVILVGMPYTGKTKLAKKIVNKNAIIVSTSDIRQSTYAGKNNFKEKEEIVFNYFFDKIENGLKNKKMVIADSTSISPEKRKRLYLLASRYKRPIRIIVMNIPLETILKINEEKNDYDKHVLIRIYEKLEREYKNISEEVKMLKHYNKDVKICDIIDVKKEEKDEIEL